MLSIPILSRLRLVDYEALIIGYFIVVLELILRFIVFFLPDFLVRWFRKRSRQIFSAFYNDKRSKLARKLQSAKSFKDMCLMQGYTCEEHLVHLSDGQILGIHRIPHGKETSTKERGDNNHVKPVVFLQHGLMMTSEVWVCNLIHSKKLPFLLADQGYDVWLGNTRGNKYSMKHTSRTPDKRDFWNFSIDDLALHDVPGVVEYILDVTSVETLAYIGFSQGSGQAFAALSINPRLAKKIHLFVALAPAMTPKGFYNPIVDAFVRASPHLIYLFFGRKALLILTLFWQRILYPTIFVKLIDTCMSFLFGWKSRNITENQKQVSYYHLYSFTSVKCVVHWLQIVRAGVFQMYDDHTIWPTAESEAHHYRNPRFPTSQIKTPIAIFYGGSDSLVDIDILLGQLPEPVFVKKIPSYEHLDFLWAETIDKTVYLDLFWLLRTSNNPEGMNISHRAHVERRKLDQEYPKEDIEKDSQQDSAGEPVVNDEEMPNLESLSEKSLKEKTKMI